MKHKKLSLVLMSAFIIILAGFFYLSPKAHYVCSGNDSVTLDFKLFRSGNFSIIGRYYDLIEGHPGEAFTYAGSYIENSNVYDLKFVGLNHEKIDSLFKGSTAGGFIKNSDIYRFNQKTSDSPNLVYIKGCLIERK